MSPGHSWHPTRRVFLKAGGTALLGSVLSSRTEAIPTRVRFGMITDLHYADVNPRGSRHYRDSIMKLRECTSLMNEQGVDFMIELGDLKDQAEPPTEATTLEYLRTIQEAYGEFKGPRHHVLGNHDLDSISKKQFMAETGMKHPHYSFVHGGLKFIVLDANHRADDSDYDRGNFNHVECRIPGWQQKWLESELSAHLGPVIVFVHQRLDGEGALFVNNASEVREKLEKHGNVLAVFQGHDHRGDRRQINGIHYHTLKGAVEGAGLENNAYAVVEAGAAGITVTAYRRAEAFSTRRD